MCKIFCSCMAEVALLSTDFVIVFSEESMAIPGVGVDKLVETGKLEHLKSGPLFWVDSADSNPCMGNNTTACLHSMLW